jgi:hypothetical protein
VYLFACRIKIKTGWFFLLSIKNYFFGHLNARKHPKKILCYKRYENSRDFLDEKAKYQPWIIKIWMKKPNMDENNSKGGWKVILHPKYG